MHDHENSERLASFADVLGGELPGAWTSTYHPPENKDDLAELADRVWDLDLVAESLAAHPLQQAAVLNRPDGAQLAVLDRHDERDGFLIAAVAPLDLPDEAYRGVHEPNGIALTDDPFLSSVQVAGDLLARYDTALAQVRLNALEDVQPSQPDRVVLTWQRDGGVAAAPIGDADGAVLEAHGFVHDPYTGVFRLSADDTRAQARALRAIGPRLRALGIGTALQHSANQTPIASAPAAAPLSPAASRARP
ncbi:hypothetical protein ACIQNI_28870 [Streptomyces sp. NPDC091266]|uniref:hypothetical protein n=1 Tax=Streptomyces sp. NPDC091266 TaxID=3365978 RepID=UPI0038017FF1